MEELQLFATPLFNFDLSEGASALNAELAEKLCEEARTSPGVKRSNEGSWHSAPDLSLRRDPCYRQMGDAVVHHVQVAMDRLATQAGIEKRPPLQFGLQGWAMVMNDGDYTVLHNHAHAHWSAVYYVDPGQPDDAHPSSGQICFVDPRRDVNSIPGLDLFPSALAVKPRAGTLLIFPGWLQHYVHPFRGHGPRVSLAYNVSIRTAPAL